LQPAGLVVLNRDGQCSGNGRHAGNDGS
jgi:hypothetical protein